MLVGGAGNTAAEGDLIANHSGFCFGLYLDLCEAVLKGIVLGHIIKDSRGIKTAGGLVLLHRNRIAHDHNLGAVGDLDLNGAELAQEEGADTFTVDINRQIGVGIAGVVGAGEIVDFLLVEYDACRIQSCRQSGTACGKMHLTVLVDRGAFLLEFRIPGEQIVHKSEGEGHITGTCKLQSGSDQGIHPAEIIRTLRHGIKSKQRLVVRPCSTGELPGHICLQRIIGFGVDRPGSSRVVTLL